jgi:hypothetical protein
MPGRWVKVLSIHSPSLSVNAPKKNSAKVKTRKPTKQMKRIIAIMAQKLGTLEISPDALQAISALSKKRREIPQVKRPETIPATAQKLRLAFFSIRALTREMSNKVAPV